MSGNSLVTEQNSGIQFRNPAAEFVYYRTYSRWLDEKSRRENWPETVARFMDFIEVNRGTQIPDKVKKKIREGILNLSLIHI